MAVKTNFSKKEFEEILSDYNLGEYEYSEPITSGTIQTNFLLQSSGGKFVFRYYESRTRGSVLFECDLIKYLNEKKYPCPVIIENKRGELIGICKDKPYAIFEFVEGKHIENPSEDQKRQLIERVAELQNVTRNYKPHYRKFRWNYSVELCGELVRKEAEKLGTENAKEKFRWLEGELEKLRLPKSLPKGICHCDFHFSNILFKDGKFNALIDFDDANFTYLVYDLASLINPFVLSFQWNTWPNFGKEENVFDFHEARWIVLEYMKHRLLSNSEKRYLFDVFKLSILFDCVWRFERGNADDFYERRKMDYLNSLGRKRFYEELFN